MTGRCTRNCLGVRKSLNNVWCKKSDMVQFLEKKLEVSDACGTLPLYILIVII